MSEDNESDDAAQVDEAIISLGIEHSLFMKCEQDRAHEVAEFAKERFVRDDPRTWWLALKQPYEVYPYQKEEWPGCLMRCVPRNARFCWLIIESDSDVYPVYRVSVDVISKVLGECGFFEYYLVGEHFEWLIADTDHNELIFTEFNLDR